MVLSTDNEKFLLGSKEAYSQFQKHKIPFAAVKIYFSGLGTETEKIDDIVGNNFRSEKDAILKSESNYAILMHNTSLKAAEAVLDRISIKFSRLKYGKKNTSPKPHLNAYACLYGAGEESDKLQFRHLGLIKPLKKNDESEITQPGIGEYLRWMGPRMKNHSRAFSIKV
jgi:hypothetical protein